MRPIAFVLASLSTLLTGCVSLGGDPAAVVDDLFGSLRDRGSPGAAVMVIRDGAVLKAEGYGLADLERQVPIGTRTSFRLGSVSKQFVAMAVMVLQERGKLGYDDAVVRFLPELSRFGEEITIRHLLTHTSGLPDYYDAMEKEFGDDWPTNDDAIDFYARWGEPRFRPGERYEYSNPGYEMLASIVERASGEPFAEFMERHIFAPLGMRDTLVYTSGAEISRRAYGYAREGDGFRLDDDHTLNLLLGAGGIYSNLEDLYLWDQALYTEKLVRRSTLEEAFRPAELNGGREIDYGFGWRVGTHLGQKRLAHAGGWVGFSTYIARYPPKKFTIIVLSNHPDLEVDDMADAIAVIHLVTHDAASR